MKFLAKVKEDGGIIFTSDYTRTQFLDYCKKNAGKFVEIIPREKISKNKRRFFEGAIVPTYCWWHEKLDHRNRQHREMVREMFKVEFNGTWIKGIWDEPRKIPQSTARLSNAQFAEFIERVLAYFDENGIPRPDPALYKKWEDTALTSDDYFDWLEENNLRPDGRMLKGA